MLILFSTSPLFKSSSWLGLLRKAEFISSRLGALPNEVVTRPHPCETEILDRITGDSWIAIGDAASMVDPLSSAGVLKALKSGVAAADRITEGLAGNPSIRSRKLREPD